MPTWLRRTWLRRTAIVLAWLLAWQLAAMLVANDILLASPIQTVLALGSYIVSWGFWQAIGFSMLRILLGFFLAFALALLLGCLAWRFLLVSELVRPAMTFIKSVPVVCFIVILLIWFGSRWVSLLAVFLVTLPAFYFAVLEGLAERDIKLAEMLTVFRLSRPRKLAAYYWPTILPFVTAAAKVAVGMAWKSGVAAELIGLPLGSIGDGIYRAKILLASADVFAWTFVVVVLSVLAEKAFLWLLGRSADWSWRLALPRGLAAPVATGGPSAVTGSSISKSYGDKPVITDLDLSLEPGGRYLLNSPSGTGKTTLLRLLAGLEQADAGSLNNDNRVSMVFQEARLFEPRSAVENVLLVAGFVADAGRIRLVLSRLLPADSLDLPVGQLSGGMRRRVELVRALLAPGQLLLLDEPFAGLDAANVDRAMELVSELQGNRILVLVSHELADTIDRGTVPLSIK